MTDQETNSSGVYKNTIDVGESRFISPRWDIDQERAFVETLVVQRTTFLFVVFGAVVAGAINTDQNKTLQLFILIGGLLFSEMLRQSIARAQQKLDIIIGILMNDPRHPITFVTKLAGPKSKRRLIGYSIPNTCVYIILSLAFLNIVVHNEAHLIFFQDLFSDIKLRWSALVS